MDRITEMLSNLQELSNEELASLEESILNEFSTAEKQEHTSELVGQLTQLADSAEAVRAEQARRATEAQALSEAAASAAARIKGVTADEATAENVSEATVAAPVDPTDPEDVVDDAPEGEVPVDAPEEVPVDEVPVDGAVVPVDEKKKKPEFSDASTESVEEAPETELAVTDDAPVQDSETELAVEEAPVAEEVVEVSTEASVEESAEAELAVEEESVELSTETPVEAEASIEETTPVESTPEVTVTAAANGSDGLNLEVPADHAPVVKPATTQTITAGADIPGISAGTEFKDSLAVADAFQKRLHTLRHVHGGDGEQHIVASYRQEFPENRQLTANDPLSNTGRINDVASQGAIIAAAGVCTPLETVYDLGCDVGVTDRPVRDALARFGADRGGIRYFSAPTLSQSSPAFADATGFWRTADDGDTWHTYGPDRTTATSPADAKPCLEMNCVQEETAFIEAVTLCLTFNNLTTRTFPELIKRQNELALVAHARVAENALLAQIEAGSTAVTAQAQVVGATREILNLFEKASASYRFKHRIGNTPLRAIIPAWVMNLLRADLALQMPGDGLELFDIAESQINAWFKSRGINVTWHLDGVGPALADLDGAGSGTAVGFEFPGTIEFALFAEGTWLYLDGGTLDIGVIRDSSLVATNQYKQFVETFEGLANVGCDSYWVSAAYEPSGQAASLVDTL